MYARSLLALSLTALLPMFPNSATAAQCDLSGKSISMEFTICENSRSCAKTRERITVIGHKVLLSQNAASDSGTIFHLGASLDPMLDPVQAKALQGSRFSEFPAGTHIRAEATASYSANELRLHTVRAMHLGDGRRISKTEVIHTINVDAGCAICRLTQFRAISTSDLNPATNGQTTLSQQSCEIRDLR